MRFATWGVVVVCACARERVTAEPHAVVAVAPASVSASAVASAPAARDAGAPPRMTWRVMNRRYVEDDAGVPREVWIEVRLEVAGKNFGPWRFDAPACTLGRSEDKHSVAQLTCYDAGGGEYIDVREKKPGQYVLVKYAQGEGYVDEPSKPTGVTTIGTFETSDPIDDVIVSADGGAYKGYGP